MHGWLTLVWTGAACAAIGAGCDTTVAATTPKCIEDTGQDTRAATWTALWADYFGPEGVASCASCHETPDRPGVIVSNFLCVAKDDCYASLTGDSHLVKATDAANPDGSKLIRELRQACTGKGRMPQDSKFFFQPADIARIDAWIEAGAPND